MDSYVGVHTGGYHTLVHPVNGQTRRFEPQLHSSYELDTYGITRNDCTRRLVIRVRSNSNRHGNCSAKRSEIQVEEVFPQPRRIWGTHYEGKVNPTDPGQLWTP